MSTPVFETFKGESITDKLLEEAARLFSYNYGMWGPLAEQKMGPFAKRGNRVRIGVHTLKSQCLPTNARNIYIWVTIEEQLVGNVFCEPMES